MKSSMQALSPIEVDGPGVIKFTQQLVRMRSVFDPDNGGDECGVSAIVAEKMRAFGWDVEVFEVAPGRPNVIATVAGNRPGPTLAFEGHVDVVTEGNVADWTIPPYEAEIRDGRLHGRGSADMKSGVAAMIFGVRALQLAGPFPGTVKLCVFVDEEGMMLGAKVAAGSGVLRGIDGVIVCEPEGDEVCPSAKGAIRLRLEITGRMAHGAMPDHARNPIPALAECVRAIADLQTMLQKTHGTDRQLGTIWLTPTVVTAGEAAQMNVIPATALLYVDVRTIPGVEHANLVQDVRERVAAIGHTAGVGIDLDVVDDRPPVSTPVEHPVVDAVIRAHERVAGHRPALGGVPGTTDGTILARDAGLATVVYGPGAKWIAHQVNEYVETSDIVRYARTYAEAARFFLKGS